MDGVTFQRSRRGSGRVILNTDLKSLHDLGLTMGAMSRNDCRSQAVSENGLKGGEYMKYE